MILVTGGAGYIGSTTCWKLYENRIPFVVIDDLSSGSKDNLPIVPFYQLDIGDPGIYDIAKYYSCHTLMNFAGKIQVGESEENPQKYFQVNVVDTIKCIDNSIRAGIEKVIFSSSASVYKSRTRALLETDECVPSSTYGYTKLMIERYLQQKNISHAILRYFNVAGADHLQRCGQSDTGSTHLIKKMCEAKVGKITEMKIFGNDYPTPDGTCIRDYIHVEDLAEAHLAVLDREGTYNVGNNRGYSVLEVLDIFQKINGEIPYSFTARRSGDPASLFSDTGSINKFWTPKKNLEDMVRSALQWELLSS